MDFPSVRYKGFDQRRDDHTAHPNPTKLYNNRHSLPTQSYRWPKDFLLIAGYHPPYKPFLYRCTVRMDYRTRELPYVEHKMAPRYVRKQRKKYTIYRQWDESPAPKD